MLDLEERCRQVGEAPAVSRPVVVAAFASAISAIVVPALADLAGRPDVVVRGAEDAEALRQLRLGSADVAIVQRYERAPFVEDDRLEYRDVAADRLRLVLPASRPARTRLDELDGGPWLLNGDGTQCSTSVLALLAAAGVTPVVRGNMDDNHALLALVAAGHGACIVPELVLDDVGRQLAITVSAQRLGARRTIVAVTRRSGDPAHRAVVAALRRRRITSRRRSSRRGRRW
jgi:DNA-binding transcriptional LysR family regulator